MKLFEVLPLFDDEIEKLVLDTIDKIYNKKDSHIDGSDREALRQSLRAAFRKNKPTLKLAIEVVEKIINKRLRKNGRWVDLQGAEDSLKQALTHAFKKHGVTEMKFNEIFNSKLTEADKQTNGKWHNPPEGEDNTPVTTANAQNMSKKDMEEYDLYLVIDKKTFGFNIGGTFLVMGMKFKPDGGLEVRVPKTQRADGKIYIPSNRSGTKFVLSKGPDTGPSIPVDTHVASSLFNRGINEGKVPPKNNAEYKKLGLHHEEMAELDMIVNDLVVPYYKWLTNIKAKPVIPGKGTLNGTYAWLRQRPELKDTYGSKLENTAFIDMLRREIGQKLVQYRKDNDLSAATMGPVNKSKKFKEGLDEAKSVINPVFQKIDKATGPFNWCSWEQTTLKDISVDLGLPKTTPVFLFDDAEGGYYCQVYVVDAPDCYYVGGIPNQEEDYVKKFKKSEEIKMIKFVQNIIENSAA